MTLNEVKDFLQEIDIQYSTSYAKDDYLLKEWHKKLKPYEKEDAYRQLKEHQRGEFANIPPKLYYIIKDLKTPQEKMILSMLLERCEFCKQYIKLDDFKEHHDKCMDINFIETNVKKYLNQQIIRDDYYSMSNDELQKRVNKIAKIIIKKSKNEQEVETWEKYLERIGEI